MTNHIPTFEDFLNEDSKGSVLIGSESEKFINDLQKFRGSSNQLPWMWLWQFCQEYPDLVNSKFSNSLPLTVPNTANLSQSNFSTTFGNKFSAIIITVFSCCNNT